MSIFRDRQVKFFSIFIVLYIALIFCVGAWFCQAQITASKSMYLEHNRAIISALLEQGLSLIHIYPSLMCPRPRGGSCRI